MSFTKLFLAALLYRLLFLVPQSIKPITVIVEASGCTGMLVYCKLKLKCPVLLKDFSVFILRSWLLYYTKYQDR